MEEADGGSRSMRMGGRIAIALGAGLGSGEAALGRATGRR